MAQPSVSNIYHVVDDLVQAAQQTGLAARIAAGVRVEWAAGLPLLQSDDVHQQLYGDVLVLEALNRSRPSSHRRTQYLQ